MGSFDIEVRWDGQPVSGVLSVSPLQSSTEVVTYRDLAGGLYKVPGREDTAVVVVERAVDADVAFDRWARAPGLKKDVELRLSDPAGGLVVSYLLRGCWVCGYAIVPDATSGAATESVSLAVNRWERVTPTAGQLAGALAQQRGTSVRRVQLSELLADRGEETERRVDALLADAQSDGAVLLLDEADALFARRTEVADAHDRYQESALDTVLDRLAAFSGPVLVAEPGEETASGGSPTRR